MTFTYPKPNKEAHHTKPRYLIGLYEAAYAEASCNLNSTDLSTWFEWECEALRYGICPDTTTLENLIDLVEASVIYLDKNKHRDHHAADFIEWGRRGGMTTHKRYGRTWFVMLAQLRWQKITRKELEIYRKELIR